TPFTTLKIEALTPIASARQTAAIVVKPGLFRSVRTAKRRSWSSVSMWRRAAGSGHLALLFPSRTRSTAVGIRLTTGDLGFHLIRDQRLESTRASAANTVGACAVRRLRLG